MQYVSYYAATPTAAVQFPVMESRVLVSVSRPDF